VDDENGRTLLATSTAPVKPQRLSPALVRILALLAVSVFINYIDRGNLSIAAPLLKDELGLSASRLGILLSSFSGRTPAFSSSQDG
jgi:sugar phosphate permease